MMVDSILFNPGNRHLGTSTSDLSLYGGQTDPAKLPVDLSEPAGSDQLEPPPPAPGATSDIGDGDMHHVMPSPVTAASVVADTVYVGSPMLIQHVDAPLTITTVPLVTGFIAAPSGSGALAPQLSVVTTADTVQGSNPDEAPLSDISPPEAMSLTAPASEHLPDSTSAASLPVAEEVLIAPPEVVTDVVAPLSDLVSPVSDILVSDILTSTAGLLPPVADVAHDAIAATTGAADDLIEGLAGADPAGGVATLVSLVSVTDMFDLHPVDAPGANAASEPGLGVLDTLVGDAAPDALLGVAHHDDHGGGPDHALHLDHPLGL